MAFFLVQYRYNDDDAGRDGLRPKHRAHLTAAAERGLILIAGPFAPSEAPGAAMVYHADSKAQVAEVIEEDPFHQAGFILSYSITEWSPIIGPWAADAARLAQ